MQLTAKRQTVRQVSASRREVAGLTLSESVYRAGLRMPRHTHEAASFSFVLRGSYTESYGRRTRECRASALVLHPSEETHAVSFHDAETHILNVRVEPAVLARVRECSAVLDAPAHFEGGALSSLALRLYKEFRRDDDVSALAIQGLAFELVAEASRLKTRTPRGGVPRWLARAREILDERPSDAPSLTSLAETVGVHPVHLAREFRRRYGRTPGEYVRQLRVERACREVSSTDAPLSEVAAAVGFYDQSHLTNTFKRFTGMTPAEFRARFRRG